MRKAIAKTLTRVFSVFSALALTGVYWTPAAAESRYIVAAPEPGADIPAQGCSVLNERLGL